MLIDDLSTHMLSSAAGRVVRDVRVGLGYTAVRLDNGRCGLAYSFRHETGGGCGVLASAGTLAGSPASDLLSLARSQNIIAAAVGLATINALADPQVAVEADALELLDARADDTVGMVGNFGPFVSPLKRRVGTLHIFERHPLPGSGFLPEEACAHVLPQCQVAILTGTALLNRTMDGLLDHCRNAREVMIVGLSTPLIPEFFKARGVTLLSGGCVFDADKALQVVSEGGGMMALRPAMRKVGLRIGRSGDAPNA